MNGEWKKTVSNALGQTTQLVEPNPAGGSDLVTSYTYDLAGHLTQTQQVRGSVTQNRTTTYNSLGQVSSTSSPEKGTTNFYYNSDYTLNYKIDSKNQKITYTYDDFKRTTIVKRYPVSSGSEDACQRTTYTYDSSSYSSYAVGKLAQVDWGGIGCTATAGSWTESYSYTQAGQMSDKQLAGGAGFSQATQNTYNDEGVMTAFTNPGNPYPGNVNYYYTFDSMGRPVTLENGVPGVNTTVASGATYNAAGQLTQLTYGPSLGWTETNTFNALGQLSDV